MRPRGAGIDPLRKRRRENDQQDSGGDTCSSPSIITGALVLAARSEKPETRATERK
jgi:hypothetical protein